MKKIFYSWQSDLNAKSNRFLIKDVIEKSIRNINKNDEIDFEIKFDSDTKGVNGVPDIAETILNKIRNCDLFICDISIINQNSTFRKTCNPNVLFELGYAISQLGWQNIICVFNSYFGKLEDLPFDLRGKRHLSYHFDPNLNRSEQQENFDSFSKSIKSAISSILYSSNSGSVVVRIDNKIETEEIDLFLVDKSDDFHWEARAKALNNKNKAISRAIIPFITVNNLSNKPIVNYKIKFWFDGDLIDVGNKVRWQNGPISTRIIERPKIENLDKNIILYTPKEEILVPDDGYELLDIALVPKKTEGSLSIKIKWQIISEECFEKGLIKLNFNSKFISMRELEDSNEISNDKKCILNK